MECDMNVLCACVKFLENRQKIFLKNNFSIAWPPGCLIFPFAQYHTSLCLYDSKIFKKESLVCPLGRIL